MGAEKPGVDTRLSQNSATAPSRIIPEEIAAQIRAMHDRQSQIVHRCVQAPCPQTGGYGDPGQSQEIRGSKLTFQIIASFRIC